MHLYFSFAIIVSSVLMIISFKPISRVNRYSTLTLIKMIDDSCEQEDDNIYMPWSIEDDRYLFENWNKRKDLTDLCKDLKRGHNGVLNRIKHLNDKNHNAFKRLFQVDDDFDSNPLRPSADVIERILWDSSLNINDFSFAYEDRFLGSCTASFNAPNVNVKGKERLLVKAIPVHRIQSIFYRDRVIWDRKGKIDFVFGTGGSSSNVRLSDIIFSYDEWIETQRQLKLHQPKMIIYCELEGIFMDFEFGVRSLFKRKSNEVSPKLLWKKLSSISNFYENLPWCDGKIIY